MRTLILLFLIAAFVFSSVRSSLAAAPPKEAGKQTKLGKYLTAVEAYQRLQNAHGNVTLIDVRTPQEYDFVGHPNMACNIPVKLWSGKFDPKAKRNVLVENPAFVDQVKARFKAGDALVLLCRSGDRSALAVDKLADAGFTDVSSIVDGFEGDMVSDKNDPDFGKRTRSGWKNSSNPWTYDLDARLVYVAPEK
jgi:rhodanese-related sulfurtransferase